MKSVNIADIAKIAGVSKATVSRVLNNPGLVREQTKLKVETAIKEHDFYPKYEARVLSSKRSANVVAVLVAEINNEYFGNLLLGISEIAEKNNIMTMIFNTENSFHKEIKILQNLRSYYLNGLIYTPSIKYYTKEEERKIIRELDKLNVPVAVVDRTFRDKNYPGVFFDDYQSIYTATKQFIKQGHREIGIVSGDFEGYLITKREKAVKDALFDKKLDLKEENILRCDYTVESAYQAVLKRFRQKDKPTAMILSNNENALGFIKAINELDLSINQDISCVGLDRIPALDYIGYGYDYIERDSTVMGSEAMRLLMKQIEQPSVERSPVFLQTVINYHDRGGIK